MAYARMIELGDEQLPRTVTPDGIESPQGGLAPSSVAFLARISRTAAALSTLVPLGSRLDRHGSRSEPTRARHYVRLDRC